MHIFAYALAALAVCVYLPLVPALWSQIRARVDLVVVPVSVRDPAGKLVTGLTRSDFVILEDDVTQTISNFAVDAQKLSAAIVVDDGLDRDALLRLAPLFIAATAGFTPDDEMISFRYDHAVRKLTDFTNDPAVIEKSFDDIAEIAKTRPAKPADVLGERGPGLLRSIIGWIEKSNEGKPPGPAQIPSGAPNPRAEPRPSDRVLHSAVFAAATALRDRPDGNRKIIVVISDGKAPGDDKPHSLKSNTDLLLENQIQVFGVSTDFAIFGAFGLLSSYARATGGDVYPGTSTKSMETAFGQIPEQARHQYVLGYVSNNRIAAGSTGLFRNIKVRTRRSNQTVTHRQGYMQYPPQ